MEVQIQIQSNLNSPVEISVLMPVHNAVPFLDETIESVLLQTFKNWELIVVDDFSTDRSSEIVLRYAARDSRVRLLSNKKKGIVYALDLAFQHSLGMYITRMDADDLMPENKLMHLLSLIKQEGRNSVVTGKVNYFSVTAVSEGYKRYENWLNSLVDQQNFNQNIFRECTVASPNWMVDRSCFENDIVLAELNYPEDYDLVFKWYRKGYKFTGIPEVTHFWREHPARLSRNSELYQQRSFFEMKTRYFLELVYQEPESIQLVGAGKKGKLVAEQLTNASVLFEWFEFADATVEKHHSKKDIQDLVEKLTILTNWPADENIQKKIADFLESKKLYFGKNLWLF